MIRTRVGYSGGTTKDPTYENIGNHAETIQIDYDPDIISYSELLDVFWDSHSPEYGGSYGQYRSLVLYHDQAQRRLAEDSKGSREKAAGAVFTTTIAPLEGFTLAELYHQKFYLQGDKRMMSEFLNSYPDPEAIVNSTAAARLNGYLGGNGSEQALKAEINGYGLSDEGRAYLLKQAGAKD